MKIIVVPFIALFFSLLNSISYATSYSVYEFTMGPSFTNVFASKINDSGQVAGIYWDLSDHAVPFLYNGTSYQTIQRPSGSDGIDVLSINNSGQIAGWASFSTPGVHPFLFDGTNSIDLGLFSGNSAIVYGINDFGQMAIPVDMGIQGYFSEYKTLLYDGVTAKDIGTLEGYRSTDASSINNSGQIVGTASGELGLKRQAFLYDGTSMKGLGTLGGLYSHGEDINNIGQVVGDSKTADDNQHAFFYDGSIMKDLGTLGGLTSRAIEVNDSGWVVGKSQITGGMSHAFVYDGSNMLDLNDLLISTAVDIVLLEAYAINSKGQILAYGGHPSTHNPGTFLLTPEAETVPEPTTLLLFGFGLLGMAGVSRRETYMFRTRRI